MLTIATAIGSLLVLALIGALLLVLKDAANKEAAAIIPEFTRSLIRKAQEVLPEEARARFEEEWSAGFEEAIEKGRPGRSCKRSRFTGARGRSPGNWNRLWPHPVRAGQDGGASQPALRGSADGPPRPETHVPSCGSPK